MDDNAEDCPVCLTTFDDAIQRPRTLPCGHTLCTPCINGLQEQGQLTCPTCRDAHTVPDAGQFPVSYTIEAFIRRLRGAASSCPPPRPGKDTAEPAPSPVTEPGQKGPAGFSRAIRSMLQEQEAKVLAAIRTCQEMQVQLDQYQTILVNWDERQQNFEHRLQALLDQSKGARVLVRQEESKVVTKKEQVQQGEQQLHDLLQVLRTVTTRLEAYKAIEDTYHCTDEGRHMAEECRGMFPDVHTVTTISKVREASSAALEAATTTQPTRETVGAPTGAEGHPDLLAAPDSSITDRLEVLLTPTMQAEDPHSLTQPARSLLQADDLYKLTQPAKSLLRAGLVFAVHQQGRRNRYARISNEDDRVYLHSLQDQTPPVCAVTVQMDEVLTRTSPNLVFLDLAWPGSVPRRVLIDLDTDTPRGLQFLLLCTGQRGPCYTNTRLWKVVDKGRPGECVLGGDYDYNNGTGGAALLPDLDKNFRYRVSIKAGSVCRWWCVNPDQAAVFCITTRECRNSWCGVFGRVVDGLGNVLAAAQHSPITDVTVVDCGVVLF